MRAVTHITTRSAWAKAMQQGEYRYPSLNKQGLIHCSEPTEKQLLAVAKALFVGQKDLVLLVIDPARLTSPLKYEKYEVGSQHSLSAPLWAAKSGRSKAGAEI